MLLDPYLYPTSQSKKSVRLVVHTEFSLENKGRSLIAYHADIVNAWWELLCMVAVCLWGVSEPQPQLCVKDNKVNTWIEKFRVNISLASE